MTTECDESLDVDNLFDEDPSKLQDNDLLVQPIQAMVTSSDWTTETIVSQLKKGNIDLNPSFQRREAWTNKRKSAFIESLFLSLPVPQLVLAEKKDSRGQYIVIDGKQRLFAIRRFASNGENDEFDTLRLTGLEIKTVLEGKNLADMIDDPSLLSEVAWYENQTIRTVVVRNWNDENFLYRVFLRLNTGNLPLSTQELRQALRPGPFIDFIADYSADSEAIRRALKLKAPDFRMRDVEILLRFFGFHEHLGEYSGNLKDFLDSTYDTLNRQWSDREPEIKEIARLCDSAIDATIGIFAADAFRRWDSNKYQGPFNRAVFDVMTYYFARSDVAGAAQDNSKAVIESYKRLCDSNRAFRESIQTTTKSVDSTFTRLSEWGGALRDVTEIDIAVPILSNGRIRV